MTDTLVDFLYKFAGHFQETYRYDFMMSIERVMHDCQKKGVVKNLRKIINHRKLKPETQNQLKFLFKASENLIERDQSSQQRGGNIMTDDSIKVGGQGARDYGSMIDEEFRNLPANPFNDDDDDMSGKGWGDADASAFSRPEGGFYAQAAAPSPNNKQDVLLETRSSGSKLSVGSPRPHSATSPDHEVPEKESK